MLRDVRSSPTLCDWIADAWPRYLADIARFGGEVHPEYLDYWLHDANARLIAHVDEDETPLAFACIGVAFPYRQYGSEYCLAEFFVEPQARRTGLGARFARELFASMRGSWELSVLRGNGAALCFWRSVVTDREEHVTEETIDFVFSTSGDIYTQR